MPELLAQRAPVDAENRRRPGLVAAGELHHDVQQGRLHLAQHQIVQVAGRLAAEVMKINAQGFGDVFAQRRGGQVIIPEYDGWMKRGQTLRCSGSQAKDC